MTYELKKLKYPIIYFIIFLVTYLLWNYDTDLTYTTMCMWGVLIAATIAMLIGD